GFFILIVFAVFDTGAGAHYLYVALFYNCSISHTVCMFQVAFQWYRNDFHVIVRMRSKPHSLAYGVIVQYTKCAEMNSLRIMIVCKTKSMITIQPAMIGMATGICLVQNCLCHYLFIYWLIIFLFLIQSSCNPVFLPMT